MENTAETLQYYCNLGHYLEGSFFILIAIIAFTGAFKPKHPIVQRKYWPWASILAGIIIPSVIYFHARISCEEAVQDTMIHVPEIYHHYIIGLLFLISGFTELKLNQKKKENMLLAAIWPFSLALIGIIYMLHNPGGFARFMRNWIGILLVLSAISRAIQVFALKKRGWMRYPWIFFIFLTGILLLIYPEPKTSFKGLGERYAKGEITKEEYNKRKNQSRKTNHHEKPHAPSKIRQNRSSKPPAT